MNKTILTTVLLLMALFTGLSANGQQLKIPKKLNLTKLNYELYTEVEINAPGEKVWDILMDFENYHKWNPFIKSIKGRAEVGEELEEELYLFKGLPPTKMKSKVNLFEKDRQFGWQGQVISSSIGMGTHSFTIERVDSNKVVFIQKEIFEGITIPVIKDFLNKVVRRKFEAMNQALKERAETP